ncbi:MAG: T9SS type A sorting domain-containing protein [Phaeodactylibacter sp.]|nr:T9SS type A sorting domain-containing protein [Phaeodactylibacter sp.]
MKKLYLFLLLLAIGPLSFAQIGRSWGQRLPDDFRENPYPRQTVKLLMVNDDDVIGANTLEELWGTVDAEFIYPLDGWANPTARDFSSGSAVTVDVPPQDEADIYGEYTAMAGDNALYVLFNVSDDEVDPAGGDKLELGWAPYVDPFDPGRPIYPDVSHWAWNADQMGYNFPGGAVVSGEDYVEMSYYSTWTEAGAYKVDLPLESSAELYAGAPVYSLKGPDLDTLGDVSGGAVPVALQTLYEAKTGGYFYLAIVPWEAMNGAKPTAVGDQISLAPKVNDWDSNNFTYQNNSGAEVVHSYGYWGSTDQNDVYWAIAFYGAKAELTMASSTFEPLNDVIKAYYSGNELIITHSEGNTFVDIYNASGVRVKTFVEADNVMDLSFLIRGFYVADIRDDAGNRSLVKFVK